MLAFFAQLLSQLEGQAIFFVYCVQDFGNKLSKFRYHLVSYKIPKLAILNKNAIII